ncbi:tetratricopeptide repeat protein [Lentzea sp. NBC_00516]|uniref:ATP-binding protein n=1 Tax=Lentzea sp. NBC_00516 TaxID=2903582 RepID=UPI002E81029D|nr:tetratricopeptide repeat protein [Lentzea sp. NBC_00516]WUD29290.1 tetratricopeptide repeat protein [Lentzea sp. NBC_00516]
MPRETDRFVAELKAAVLRAERRLGKRLDRKALARDTSVSKSSVYGYLNGTSLPPSDVLDALLTAIGAPGSELAHLATLRDAADLERQLQRRDVPATPVPHQLPAVAAGFIGRAEQLRDLDVLAQAGAPVAIIDGTAGAGKTTLALRWAHNVVDRFPDGRLHADLRGFALTPPADPAQVLHRFLQDLGMHPTAIPADLEAREARFRTLVADRRLLILLDNAASAEQVTPLLPGTTGSIVIITSRDRMDALVARHGAHRVTVGALPAKDALALLGDRIGERVPAELGAASELVDLCGRLPLALAIVAARATAVPDAALSMLADELRHEGLAALSTQDPGLDLRAVFEWSYARLPDAAAKLFRLLGNHPGTGIGLHACAALTDERQPPRAELTWLTGAHLVAERTVGRFEFHDLLHAYAADLAAQHENERRAATGRLLDHYLDTALLANRYLQPCWTGYIPPVFHHWSQPAITSYDQALAWFSAEFASLRALISYAGHHGFEAHAWRLAWACTVFLRRTGRREDRVAVHRIALAAARRAGDHFAHATILRLLADATARLGEHDNALDLLHTALAEFHSLGHDDGSRQTHLSLARARESAGEHARALEHARLALRLAQRAPDLLAKADGHTSVAAQLSALGEHRDALLHGTRALSLYSRLGHAEGVADVLTHIGASTQELGRHQLAIAAYTRSLDIDRSLGDRYWEAYALDRLADLHALTGAGNTSRTLREEALAILESLWHPDAELVRTKLIPLGRERDSE